VLQQSARYKQPFGVASFSVDAAEELQRGLQHLGHRIEGKNLGRNRRSNNRRALTAKELFRLETQRRVEVRHHTKNSDFFQFSADRYRSSSRVNEAVRLTSQNLRGFNRLIVRILDALLEVVLDATVITSSSFER
jgi:hypothetical protein